jgi:hypothetical protein
LMLDGVIGTEFIASMRKDIMRLVSDYEA